MGALGMVWSRRILASAREDAVEIPNRLPGG
jgi:hypothetical protein